MYSGEIIKFNLLDVQAGWRRKRDGNTRKRIKSEKPEKKIEKKTKNELLLTKLINRKTSRTVFIGPPLPHRRRCSSFNFFKWRQILLSFKSSV